MSRFQTAVASFAGASAVKDLDLERQRQATSDTARFVDENLSHLVGFRADDAHGAKLALLAWALRQAPTEGLVLEFGVATGETLRVLSEGRGDVHGFDSFEGLPEHWYGEYTHGSFAQPVPDVPGATIHVGWFDETLPDFLRSHGGPVALVHLDADLYRSTKIVFDLVADRFVEGTILVFDEYFNYPGWRQHEHKAFEEFVGSTGWDFNYIGYNAMHEQLVVRLG